LNERKNFSSVIKAFELLNRDDYRLILVGNFMQNFSISQETQQVLKRAKKSKNIEFKSNIDDEKLIELYNQAKIFLFPSLYEGFGLPPLEAMACGTPVITSNISSMPEVCQDAAIYTNPHSIEDIKNKLEMLIDDEALQKQMREKGLLHVKEFTWEKSAQKHMEVFKKALQEV
jgi:glycosyltransferase involved in cell wall biosynthesis